MARYVTALVELADMEPRLKVGPFRLVGSFWFTPATFTLPFTNLKSWGNDASTLTSYVVLEERLLTATLYVRTSPMEATFLSTVFIREKILPLDWSRGLG